MFKKMKKYFKKSVRNCNYELKCEKLEVKIKELEKELLSKEREIGRLENKFLDSYIFEIEALLKTARVKNHNLINDNFKLIYSKSKKELDDVSLARQKYLCDQDNIVQNIRLAIVKGADLEEIKNILKDN